tara:strand:+ start:6773 stop:7192 length:420 start_codon:yes stop_codon:yes gene_type:complete
MANNIYQAGLNQVGSYQVSGVPYVTGTLNPNAAGPAGLKIEFPYVTSWIEILNYDTTSPVSVGFSSLGVQGTNYFNVIRNSNNRGDPTSHVLPLKVTELYLSGASQDCAVIAGLTYIPIKQVTVVSPSGSNWSGSVGVG